MYWYHLLVLCCVLALVESRIRYRPPYRSRGRRPPRMYRERELNTIENVFVEQRDKLEKFCAKATKAPTEMYGTDYYYLSYSIPEKTTATVKITKNFLHTMVLKDFKKIIEDVKILPDIVKIEDAVYTIDSQMLKITIPYRVPIGTAFHSNCGVVNKDVINVPLVKYPTFTYRLQEAIEN
ncbi:uncharacterized protein LOC112048370 [Bicyclus anynana]|uniref:Uncharacterized protein LOC112048370 n=1 Tax=Bicyclus anynana TaxID=110368 RepID=A0A6J1N1B2_BICAN|nr:uncharacterized protein LOC112048370 [Bicyclus anynana]